MRRQLCILAVAAAAAAGAGYWLQFDDLRRIAPVMVALFGVLTGFLVNAMIRTATALEGTLTLNPSELQQIASTLKEQQSGWKRLFHLYLAVIVLTILGALVPAHWSVTLWGRGYDLSILGIATFFGFVAIVLARTLTVVDGVSALQDLRSKLLIAAAEKREREERRRAANEVVFKPGPLGPDFGRKVAFPGGSPPQAR
jgi:hypothetical protein